MAKLLLAAKGSFRAAKGSFGVAGRLRNLQVGGFLAKLLLDDKGSFRAAKGSFGVDCKIYKLADLWQSCF